MSAHANNFYAHGTRTSEFRHFPLHVSQQKGLALVSASSIMSSVIAVFMQHFTGVATGGRNAYHTESSWLHR